MIFLIKGSRGGKSGVGGVLREADGRVSLVEGYVLRVDEVITDLVNFALNSVFGWVGDASEVVLILFVLE